MDNEKKKIIPLSARKPVKRKAKDKPKRPLSAYNFFFRDERAKIVAIVEEDADIKDNDLTEEEVSRLRKDTGKVSFEEMGKIIGQRWKKIDEERHAHYSKLAEGSAQQYKVAMKKYNDKQEEIREKEKQIKMQYAQVELAQRGHQPPMMRYNQSYAPPDMHPAQMSYPTPYSNPMDHGSYHGYPQMDMMNPNNPYYVPYAPPPGAEGHPSHGNTYHGDNTYLASCMQHNSRYEPPPPSNGYYRSDIPSNDNGQSFRSQQEPSPQSLEHDSNVSNFPTQEQRSYNGNKQSNNW